MNTEFKFRDVNADMSDIPSYASCTEATILVAEANNALFDSLKKEIGLQELGVFESTGNFISYVIEEGEETGGEEPKEEKKSLIDKGKAVVGKIIEFIKAAAAKVKGLFEQIMRKISELTARAAAAFGGKLSEERMYNAIENHTIKFHCGDFDKLFSFIAHKDLIKMGYAKKDSGLFEVLRNMGYSGEELKTKVPKAKEVEDHFEGEKKDHTLSNTPEGKQAIVDICKVINEFSKTNDALKKMYKNCEDHFKNLVSECESAKEVDKEKLEEYQTNVRQTTVVFGAALSCYYKVVRQDVAIAIKISLRGKKPKKAAEGDNAAPAEGEKPETTAQLNSAMVESLFNWSF